MSKGNTFENDLLKLIFNATAIADLAEDDTSSPLTNLYISLHTADPGEAGDQSTSEVTYTPYARIAVPRTAGGWTVAANTAENAALVQFAACSSGSSTATYLGVGTASSGAGKLLYSGELVDPLAIAVPNQPQFPAGTIVVGED
jgi:hypothetical protein